MIAAVVFNITYVRIGDMIGDNVVEVTGMTPNDAIDDSWRAVFDAIDAVVRNGVVDE